MYSNYSTAHLSSIIKSGLGKGFLDLLKDHKLEGACRLPCISELIVTQIAERLHIQYVGYLSKLIRSSFGLTPTQYRPRCRDTPGALVSENDFAGGRFGRAGSDPIASADPSPMRADDLAASGQGDGAGALLPS